MIDRVDVPWYHKALDFPALWEEFPPPPDFLDRVHQLPAERILALQEHRFRQQIARAWEVPFYRLHWRRAGLDRGDIRGLADICRIPPYTVHHLRESIERCPPFGDYMGIELGKFPLVLQTSGGTTGLPRPMLYAPRDREVMNILGGRRYYLQGIRPGDLVQSTYSIGLSNGGFATREGLWKYTGAIPVMTGSGSATPTRRQIEIARAWGVSHLFGFPPTCDTWRLSRAMKWESIRASCACVRSDRTWVPRAAARSRSFGARRSTTCTAPTSPA